MKIWRTIAIYGAIFAIFVVSWIVAIPHLPLSRANEQAAQTQAFLESMLATHLPKPPFAVELELDDSHGNRVKAFPDLVAGTRLGPTEMAQFNLKAKFMSALSFSYMTNDTKGWKRIGKATLLPEQPGSSPVFVAVYSAPENKLGFDYAGRNFSTFGEFPDLIDYLQHAIKSDPAETSIDTRQPPRNSSGADDIQSEPG
jgi:hypothetical protein